MPDWLFPHRGYSIERIVAQEFLQAQGTFEVALGVMFTYVFLFGSPGGPAKVVVLASGLMGSLSGSAVANTATTGIFTTSR